MFNAAVQSVDTSIPGGGTLRVLTTAAADVRVYAKLPDGRAASAAAYVRDNGTIAVYLLGTGTSPRAIAAGELTLANLTATDVTGELSWAMAAQTSGLHRAGVDTVLRVNGCIYTPGASLAMNGPATMEISGGNLPSAISGATTMTAGKVTIAPPIKRWITSSASGTFTFMLSHPTRGNMPGSGVYLPKTNSVSGFLRDTTVGGRIEVTQP